MFILSLHPTLRVRSLVEQSHLKNFWEDGSMVPLFTNKIRKVVLTLKTNKFSLPDSRSSKASSEFNPGVH